MWCVGRLLCACFARGSSALPTRALIDRSLYGPITRSMSCLPGSVGMGQFRMSNKRSNRPAWASAPRCRICIHRTTESVGWHRLFDGVSAFRAGDRGLMYYFVRLRRHRAYPVRMRNPARMGSSTSSRYTYPSAPLIPRSENSHGSRGVKQQRAANPAPPSPKGNNHPFIASASTKPT